jgi:hypothetical protein
VSASDVEIEKEDVAMKYGVGERSDGGKIPRVEETSRRSVRTP